MKKNLKKLHHKAADFQYAHEEISLGATSSYSLVHDPKHVLFVLSRYKFCAQMLQGKKRLLELGCGEGLGLPLIAQGAQKVYGLEWEQRPLDSIHKRLSRFFPNIELICLDPTKQKLTIKVDAVYSVDFIEHIDGKRETFLMKNIIGCLPQDGVLITGTPNVTSKTYASYSSKVHHVNLKSAQDLRKLMETYFENVFIFGMNDEVVHTGYAAMCHYLWAVAAGVKKSVRK